MTIIAPLLFVAIFMFAAVAAMLSLSGAIPQIARILKTVHGSEIQKSHRKITVYAVAQSPSAEILPFPARQAHNAAPTKLAA